MYKVINFFGEQIHSEVHFKHRAYSNKHVMVPVWSDLGSRTTWLRIGKDAVTTRHKSNT